MSRSHDLLGTALGAGLACLLLLVVSLGGECTIEISGGADTRVSGQLVTPRDGVIELSRERIPLSLSVPRGTEGRLWTASGREIVVAVSYGRPLVRYRGSSRGERVTFRAGAAAIHIGSD